MGIKRIIDTDFWNDDKVMEMFSPEDKLFMLYLLSNPHTSQLGIYAINPKLMAFELGYSIETIKVLLDRFETKYNIIRYSETTKEVAIRNYLKYSIITGGKPVYDCLIKEIKKVKDMSLIMYVYNNIKVNKYNNNTVNDLIQYINDNYDDIYNDNDNERLVNDSSTTRENKEDYQAEFEELWQKYPNKKGKDMALKSYIKARKSGVSRETIEKGIENYAMYCRNKDKQYIKHGSTWFNQKSWQDEYTAENKPVKKSAFDVLRELCEEAENEEARNIDGVSFDMFELPEYKG